MKSLFILINSVAKNFNEIVIDLNHVINSYLYKFTMILKDIGESRNIFSQNLLLNN